MRSSAELCIFARISNLHNEPVLFQMHFASSLKKIGNLLPRGASPSSSSRKKERRWLQGIMNSFLFACFFHHADDFQGSLGAIFRSRKYCNIIYHEQVPWPREIASYFRFELEFKIQFRKPIGGKKGNIT